MKKNITPSAILLIGAILVSLRIVFPVLKCVHIDGEGDNAIATSTVEFFSLSPKGGCVLHNSRTYPQAASIVLLTGVAFWVTKKKENIDR